MRETQITFYIARDGPQPSLEADERALPAVLHPPPLIYILSTKPPFIAVQSLARWAALSLMSLRDMACGLNVLRIAKVELNFERGSSPDIELSFN